jgi:hypothetical protein
MAVQHEIEILISVEGDIQLEIKGMKGPSCVAEIEKFASGVGTITAIDKKAEFYQTQTKSQGQKRA